MAHTMEADGPVGDTEDIMAVMVAMAVTGVGMVEELVGVGVGVTVVEEATAEVVK